MFDVKGDGDVFRVEIGERGPARITVKVAPTKDKAENWKSSFIKLTVWSGGNNPTPGAALVASLKERDKIRFTAYAKTETWTDRDGNEKSAMAWNCTRLELGTWPKGGVDDGQAGAPLQQPDDGDGIPF